MKNNPAPKPNASAPSPTSLFICSAANDRLDRSSAAKKTTIQTRGRTRTVTRRMIARSLSMSPPPASFELVVVRRRESQVALVAIVGLRTGVQRNRRVARELAHVDVLGHAGRRRIEPFVDLLLLVVDGLNRVVGELLVHVFPTEEEPSAEVDARHVAVDAAKPAFG